MARMPASIDAAGLERMLLDPDTPDEAIRPYLMEDAAEATPFRPAVRANPAMVEAPKTEAAVALASLNGLARWRRQQRYRAKVRDWTGLRLVSEGDSWFQYPLLLTDVIDWLSEPYAILSLDAAGDLVADMVRQGELIAAVAAERPDAVLLSGGGNDLLGASNLARALRRFEEDLPPTAYLGDAFEANLRSVLDNYERLLARLRQVAPTTPVLTHVYDYAIPAGGRWLGQPMRALGIEDLALQHGIVRAIVDRFDAALHHLTTTFAHVHVIDTRGAIGQGSWHDELHPTNQGYRVVAERFGVAIAKATGTPVPTLGGSTEAAMELSAAPAMPLDVLAEEVLLREIGRRAVLATAGDTLADALPIVFPSSLEGTFPALQARGEQVVAAARDVAAAEMAPGDIPGLVQHLAAREGLAGEAHAMLVATVLARRAAERG